MKKTMNSTMNKHDVLLWGCVALVTLAAFLSDYAFHFTGPIKALVWLVWLVLVLVLGFFTGKGQQVFVFANEAKAELQKVVWPSRQETVQTTSIVMLMVVVTGFLLWGVDLGMMWTIGKITHLG
ncbi:MAG: preprotein translocase subunit SecE [Legionellales bacterium RIFCSPHIGHO2_12_FULL_42_9]|nr:MAG: preprotein translocase subunit SecE [Legionellales bacterium RIFCSPHIGHO2_12_FULL_42_9]